MNEAKEKKMEEEIRIEGKKNGKKRKFKFINKVKKTVIIKKSK